MGRRNINAYYGNSGLLLCEEYAGRWQDRASGPTVNNPVPDTGLSARRMGMSLKFVSMPRSRRVYLGQRDESAVFASTNIHGLPMAHVRSGGAFV